ncbi:MAG: hypothetical protein ACYTG0_32925 [Planctomycetota bacterium]|jgi:hypothetical protein
MDRSAVILLLLLFLSGCSAGLPSAGPAWLATQPYYNNPAMLPVRDRQYAWESVVDVVDDYFRIDNEALRLADGHLIEGRIDTFPEVGSTILEPWRRDSANPYEKLQSTLQTIRRWARVRMTPTQGGYLVDVAVFKEMEDLAQPMHSTSGAATFRYDSSLIGIESSIGDQPAHEGWIRLGRDAALEQQIVAELLTRAGAVPMQIPTGVPLRPPCPVNTSAAAR